MGYLDGLAIGSGAILVASLLLMLVLMIRAVQMRMRRWDGPWLERQLDTMDLTVDGFRFEVDLEKGWIDLADHPGLEMPEGLAVNMDGYCTDHDISPAFEDSFHVFDASDELLSNLRANANLLAPATDFRTAWEGVLDDFVIGNDFARLKFFQSPSNPSPAWPVDLLPRLLPDAVTAIRAICAAARPPEDPDAEPESHNYVGPPIWLLGTLRWFASHRLKLLLLSLFVLAGTATLVSWRLVSIRQDMAAMSWPSVQGVMTESRVEHTTHTTRRDGFSEAKDYYKAIIQYEYEVNGKKYTGDRVSFLRPGVHGEDASYDVTTDFEKGSKVAVHYDPDDPSEAIIERVGKPPSPFSQVLLTSGYLPALALLAFTLYLYGMVRSARKRIAQARTAMGA